MYCPLDVMVQVLEHCREVFADRQARGGTEEGGGSVAHAAATSAAAPVQPKGKAFTAKEAAFRAAVNAARRRGPTNSSVH